MAALSEIMLRSLKYLVIGFCVIVFLAAAFGGGLYVGLINNENNGSELKTAERTKTNDAVDNVDLSPFWKAWRILDDKFVDSHARPANGGASTSTATTTSTTEKRVWGAISGMTDALGDPYTVFLPPEEKKNFEESIIGNFGGVGMEVDIKNHVLTVVSALKDTPAKGAGIKFGDQIIKIDEQETRALTLTEAINLIRGEIGSLVILTIRREGEDDRPITVTRAKISIPTLGTETKDGVFIIRLYNFNGNATSNFREALREFIGAETDKMIIDLRGNPGGLLDAAVDMASWFLPAGKPVIIEHRGDTEEEKIYRSYGYDVFTDQLKLAILIDGGSASAAEILAGALSEHGIATLIGEKSFGKGSVQELVEVTPESSLKITIAKWLTPKHKSLVDNGLEPDILIKMPDAPPTATSTDPVLLRAIDFLKQKK